VIVLFYLLLFVDKRISPRFNSTESPLQRSKELFKYDESIEKPFYVSYLEKNGFSIDSSYLNNSFERWSGDSVELNRGEILLSTNKSK
jgi:hypothetical protein